MKRRGFTLVEIMITVSIIGLISAIATPGFRRAVERVQEVGCIRNRGVVEETEQVFAFEQNRHSSNIAELINAGYLKHATECPADGTWRWASYPANDARHNSILECSVHGLRFSVGGGAPVTVSASDYSRLGGRWFQDGTDMWTAWRGQWLEYKFDFVDGAGVYNLDITAKNHASGDWSLVDGYENFRVEVYVDGQKQGTALIPASDDTYNTGNYAINIPNAGYHDIRLRWTNDAWNPGAHQDANIQFSEISFSSLSLQKQDCE